MVDLDTGKANTCLPGDMEKREMSTKQEVKSNVVTELGAFKMRSEQYLDGLLSSHEYSLQLGALVFEASEDMLVKLANIIQNSKE